MCPFLKKREYMRKIKSYNKEIHIFTPLNRDLLQKNVKKYKAMFFFSYSHFNFDAIVIFFLFVCGLFLFKGVRILNILFFSKKKCLYRCVLLKVYVRMLFGDKHFRIFKWVKVYEWAVCICVWYFTDLLRIFKKLFMVFVYKLQMSFALLFHFFLYLFVVLFSCSSFRIV